MPATPSADGTFEADESGVIRARSIEKSETSDLEAGGHAVRRTPMLAVVVASLLGASGCAGFPQRLDWSSPRTDIPNSNDKSEPGRISWWRRPSAEATATASNAEVARSTETKASTVAAAIPGDVWPESKSEWLARHFPILSRHWNEIATASEPGAATSVRPDTGRVSARSRPVPRTGRDDDEVRPVDASEDNDRAPRRQPTHFRKTRSRWTFARADPVARSARGRESRRARYFEGRSWSQTQCGPWRMGTLFDRMAAGFGLGRRQRIRRRRMAVDNDSESEKDPEAAAPREPPLLQAFAPDDEPELEPEAARETPMPPVPSVDPAALVIAPAPAVSRTPPSLLDADQSATPAQSGRARSSLSELDSYAGACRLGPAGAQGHFVAAARSSGSSQNPTRRSYASPPPMAPPQPRRTFLALLFAEETTETQRHRNFRLPCFRRPTTRRPPSRIRCFRLPWILPQSRPRDAANRPQKPCVLTAWFQKRVRSWS